MHRRAFEVIDLEPETYERTNRFIEELEVLRVIKKYCEETRDDKEADRTPEWLLNLVRLHFPYISAAFYMFTSRISPAH